jgi:peroxiredoxin
MKKIYVLILFVGLNLFGQQHQLPDLNLADVNGKKVSLKNDFLEKDKFYVFSFWATWCSPCINELEEINEVYDDWKKNINVELVAVSIDDSRTVKRVRPLVNGKEWTYKILLDTNQDLKRALTIVNVPYTIIVKNGKIVHIQNGYSPGSGNELLEKLKTL